MDGKVPATFIGANMMKQTLRAHEGMIAMDDTALRAVIVPRVSTERQAEEGTSIEGQELACLRRAANLGAPVHAIYRDEGVSGARYHTRDGIQKALADVEAQRAHFLITYKMDRAGRDVEVLRDIKRRVETAGGELVFADGMQFAKNATGNLMFTQLAGFAEFEREQIRERTMDAKRRLAENGIQPSRGRVPYAYRVVTRADVIAGRDAQENLGAYKVTEARAAVVRDMYRLYAEGMSLRQLSHWLHSKGIQTHTGTPYWHANTIRDLLLNPVNKGTAIWGHHEHVSDETRLSRGYKTDRYDRPAPRDKWIEIQAPAIVSADLWQQVVDRIRSNRATKSGNPARRYMLTGLLRCKQCGVRMIAKSRRDFQYYYCRYYGAAQSPSGKVCDRRSFRLRDLDAFMLRGVLEVIRRPELIKDAIAAYRRYHEASDSASEIASLRKQLREVEMDEEAIVTAQVEGVRAGINSAIYAKKLAGVAGTRAQLQERLQGLERSKKPAKPDGVTDMQALESVLSAVEEVLTSAEMSAAEKNELLAHVVERAHPLHDGLEIEFKPIHDQTVGLMVIRR